MFSNFTRDTHVWILYAFELFCVDSGLVTGLSLSSKESCRISTTSLWIAFVFSFIQEEEEEEEEEKEEVEKEELEVEGEEEKDDDYEEEEEETKKKRKKGRGRGRRGEEEEEGRGGGVSYYTQVCLHARMHVYSHIRVMLCKLISVRY